MACRGCGPSPDPEQDREHNDWCPDNPRRDLATTEQVIRGLRAENERLREERDEALRLLARLSRSSTTTAPAISDTTRLYGLDGYRRWP
jgi:hypothetical protein